MPAASRTTVVLHKPKIGLAFMNNTPMFDFIIASLLFLWLSYIYSKILMDSLLPIGFINESLWLTHTPAQWHQTQFALCD